MLFRSRGGIGADMVALFLGERAQLVFGGGFRHRRDQRPHHRRLPAEREQAERRRDLPDDEIKPDDARHGGGAYARDQGAGAFLQPRAFQRADDGQHQERHADITVFVEGLAEGRNRGDEIEARRKTVRENYQPGLAALKQQDFPGRESLLAALDRALAKANDYRAQADRAITQPRDARDENLRKTFVPVITDSVNTSLKVWFAALHAAAAADPTLASLAVIKELGWRMRDVSGQERSNISSAIASGAPVPPAALIHNAGTRAQANVLWAQLENLTAGPETHPEIKAAMAAARDQYFAAFRKLADDMKAVGDAEGSKYPITATQYVETTTPQIGTLLNVMYAAGKASEAHSATLKAGALTVLIIDLLALLAGAAVAAGTLFVVLRRITDRKSTRLNSSH